VRALFATLLVASCASTPFYPSSIGVRHEPLEAGAVRYVHRDSGVGFVLPVAADEGDREQDDAGFERVVVAARSPHGLYRVLVLRPTDGTSVPPADAMSRLADGMIAGATPTRDEATMVGTHAARRISVPHATSDGRPAAFLVTADDRALVMLEVVGWDDVDAVADRFFATLELGCDR
jgi:hypothetical protein